MHERSAVHERLPLCSVSARTVRNVKTGEEIPWDDGMMPPFQDHLPLPLPCFCYSIHVILPADMKDLKPIKFSFHGEDYECSLTQEDKIEIFDIVRPVPKEGNPDDSFSGGADVPVVMEEAASGAGAPPAPVTGDHRDDPEEVEKEEKEEVRIRFANNITHTWLVPTEALVNIGVMPSAKTADERGKTTDLRLPRGSAVQCRGTIANSKRQCKNLTLNHFKRGELETFVCWQHKDQVEYVIPVILAP